MTTGDKQAMEAYRKATAKDACMAQCPRCRRAHRSLDGRTAYCGQCFQTFKVTSQTAEGTE